MSELFKETIQSSFILVGILVIAGILHMIVVKTNILRFLCYPIWKNGFGKNKTWRGLIVMPFAGWIGTALIVLFIELKKISVVPDITQVSTATLGMTLGLFYALFELPNSYLKRRFGISEGKLAESKPEKILFFTLDHFDSLLGCLLVFYIFFGWSTSLTLCLLIAPLVHIVINLLLWLVKIRKEPF